MVRGILRYAVLLMAASTVMLGSATAFDDSEYPDFKGKWRRIPVPGVGGQISFDQYRSWGKGQGAQLTPEYQKVYDNNLKTQADGYTGDCLAISCLGFGMQIMIYGGEPLEFVITPGTTYILLNWI